MNPFIHAPTLMRLRFLVFATVLSGCAGNSSASQAGAIRITSDPAGAIAYADGAELGATPLEIVPGSHFRSGFVGLSYRYHGTLSLKKAGCETWSIDVNDYVLSKDVHARLKCDPDFRPPAAPAPSPLPCPSAPNRSYVERLERIKSLHEKGLISDEEYRQLRARILEKL